MRERERGSAADLDERARSGGRNTNGAFREPHQINCHFPSEQNKNSMSFSASYFSESAEVWGWAVGLGESAEVWGWAVGLGDAVLIDTMTYTYFVLLLFLAQPS